MALLVFVSGYIDKKIISKNCCPICNTILTPKRDKGGMWLVKCENCNLVSPINYSGIKADDN